jgi:hypothetical protein
MNDTTTNIFVRLFGELVKAKKKGRKYIKKVWKYVTKSSDENPDTFKFFQLTTIYSLAFIALMYTIRDSVGYFPEPVYTIFPFLKNVFRWSLFSILVSPEKTYFFYMLIFEVIIIRPVFDFSLVVKFNIMLIFILEMIQHLFLELITIIVVRESEVMDYGRVIPRIDQNVAMYLNTILFFSFCWLYWMAYFQSIKGSLPVYPGFLKVITDSSAFWLRLKPKKK